MVNQTIFHDETEVFRLAIPTAGVTHPILGAFTSIGCVPAPVSKTGTCVTTNTDATLPGCTVVGTGTQFQSDSDFQKGRFLVHPTLGVARRIKEIISDTVIILTAKFPSNYSGAPLLVTNKPAMITAKSVGTVDAIMQEQDFVIGESFIGGGAPISYDVSATGAQIDFSIHE